MLLLMALACRPQHPDFDALRAELQDASSLEAPDSTPRPLPPEMDMARTTWRLRYVDPDIGGGLAEYDLEFLPSNLLKAGNPADTTPDNDHWVQLGQKVNFSFNDAYVSYQGTMKDRHHIEGEAVNVKGQRWAFTLERAGGPAPAGWDQELSPNRWSLRYTSPISGEPRDIQLEFRPGGALYTSESESTEGHAWSRADGTLTFSFTDGYATYTATGQDGAWSGQATNVEKMTWDFTLTRLEDGATNRWVAPSSGALHKAEGAELTRLVTGSTWNLTDYDPIGPVDFTLTFEADGAFTRTALGESDPAGKDNWEVSGKEVVFHINNGFTEQHCLPLDDNSMIGWARNSDGREWSFTLTRSSAAPPAPAPATPPPAPAPGSSPG